MGLRGPNARSLNRPMPGAPALTHAWSAPGLTRAERVIAFVESLPLTAGKWAGQQFRLRPWQRRELLKIYRTDASGRRTIRTVCWSTARANGKTGLAAVLVLAHLVGPEAQPRGEIFVCANDKFQASRLFGEVVAIIEKIPWIADRVSIRRHEKMLEDRGGSGSIFAALSSDVPTKHGLAPDLVIYDELGQSQSRELLDAMQTALGKKPDPMLCGSFPHKPPPTRCP